MLIKLIGILDVVLFVSTPGLLPMDSLRVILFWRPPTDSSQTVSAILATGSWLKELKEFPDAVASRNGRPGQLGGEGSTSAGPPYYVDHGNAKGDADRPGDAEYNTPTPLTMLRGRVRSRGTASQQRAASVGSNESQPRSMPRRPVPAYWELENWVERREGAERQVVVHSVDASPRKSAHAVTDEVAPAMKRCSSASVIEMRPAAMQNLIPPSRRVRFDIDTQSPGGGGTATSIGSFFAGAQAQALATRLAPTEHNADFPSSAINTVTVEMITIPLKKTPARKDGSTDVDVGDLEIEWECREVVEGSGEWECTEKVIHPTF